MNSVPDADRNSAEWTFNRLRNEITPSVWAKLDALKEEYNGLREEIHSLVRRQVELQVEYDVIMFEQYMDNYACTWLPEEHKQGFKEFWIKDRHSQIDGEARDHYQGGESDIDDLYTSRYLDPGELFIGDLSGPAMGFIASMGMLTEDDLQSLVEQDRYEMDDLSRYEGWTYDQLKEHFEHRLRIQYG